MRKNPRTRIDLKLLVPLWILALAAVAQPALPQDRPGSRRPQEFGVSQEVTYNLGPSDFVPQYTSTPIIYFGNSVFCASSGTCSVVAPVKLPSGVRITSVTVFYEDRVSLGNPSFSLSRWSSTDSGNQIAGVSGTALPYFEGGYTSLELPVSADYAVVDNENYHYSIYVFGLLTTGTDPALRLVRVAIRYLRQVSAAPASATFDDVPTDHPYFRHIEALFESGITAGCNATPPMFCADRPISRGEMAVFLAKALGLHWP